MSKLEMVRNFNDTEPQLQIVQSVKTLQQTVREMNDDLNRLPGAVSAETASALEPLSKLRQEVKQVLAAYDKVNQNQRQTLDELSRHMTEQAAATFESRARKLESSISGLSVEASTLKASIKRTEQAAGQMQALPKRLSSSQKAMTQAADELTLAANKTRPRIWRQVIGLVLAGAVGAVLVMTGQAAFERLLPKSAEQKNATWAAKVWSHATPKERRFLNQIASRPDR